VTDEDNRPLNRLQQVSEVLRVALQTFSQAIALGIDAVTVRSWAT
jgi:hypothetical protein